MGPSGQCRSSVSCELTGSTKDIWALHNLLGKQSKSALYHCASLRVACHTLATNVQHRTTISWDITASVSHATLDIVVRNTLEHRGMHRGNRHHPPSKNNDGQQKPRTAWLNWRGCLTC